jgi:hypothetical protein
MRRLVKDSGVGGSSVGFRGVSLLVLGVGHSNSSLSGVELAGLGVAGPGVVHLQEGVSGVGLSDLGVSLLGDSLLGVSSSGDVCFGSHNDTSLGGAFTMKSSSHSTVSSGPGWDGDGVSRLLLGLALKLMSWSMKLMLTRLHQELRAVGAILRPTRTKET